MAAQATQDTTVKPMTHGLRTCRASEMAPSSGTDSTTSTEASADAMASRVLDWWRSSTNHTAKYSVATFMEKIVFAKSYRAQLPRSRRVPYVLICGSSVIGKAVAVFVGQAWRAGVRVRSSCGHRRPFRKSLSQFYPKSSP